MFYKSGLAFSLKTEVSVGLTNRHLPMSLLELYMDLKLSNLIQRLIKSLVTLQLPLRNQYNYITTAQYCTNVNALCNQINLRARDHDCGACNPRAPPSRSYPWKFAHSVAREAKIYRASARELYIILYMRLVKSTQWKYKAALLFWIGVLHFHCCKQRQCKSGVRLS